MRSLPLPEEWERKQPARPAETAQRWIEVHWGHGAGSKVQAFKLYWGLAAGEYLAVEEVHPRPERDGTYLSKLRVPADQTVHIAVSAVGPGGEGPVSNQGICAPGCRRAAPVGRTSRSR